MNSLKNKQSLASQSPGKKVAIVYDRVNKWGGAERVLLSLHQMFPRAPLYTSVYDPKKASWASVFPKIYTSFLQKIPFAKSWHEGLGWLMPLAFESFDFNEFDLVISVTSEAAKGIITGPKTTHVCYMLTPTRYLWSHYDEYFKNKLLRFVSKPVVNYLKNWDKIAVFRPDHIISISTAVQKRVKKYYGLDSEIIFPPVHVSQNKPSGKSYEKDGEYFLCVSRLVPYKKVDLVVDVFNKLNLPLVIVGVGSQEKSLKRAANNNIVFKGKISDEKLKSIYKRAKALIVAQEEDFGIVFVEAQALGVPVIAYGKGGVLDIVVDKQLGVLFNSQNEQSLIHAIAKFGKIRFNHSYLKTNAKRFEEAKFERQLQGSLVRAYTGGRGRNSSLAQKQK
ncbi:glycosyltransferase [Candidatus Microgenomates bacterium]|nr:glycosyltransferase [Candidatus Microgenomates bacterium]